MSFLSKIRKDKRGNVLAIAAAALPLVIGSAGLASDTIQWALWKRQLQRAADSAAIAGVYDRIANDGATTNATVAVDNDLTQNNHTIVELVATYPQVDFPADTAAYKIPVRVKLAVQKRLGFSSLFLSTAPTIHATAIAATIKKGTYCVVSLENTDATGITATGNAAINLGCGMITNSSSLDAAIATGSSTVTASPIAAYGDIPPSDHWGTAELLPFTVRQDDPFASVSVPTFTGCQGAVNKLQVNASQTVSVPAAASHCYSSMKLDGNVTLGNGVYYVDGGNFSIGSGASVTCMACTFVMTSSTPGTPVTIGTVGINGNATVNLHAPTSGDFPNILFYQDRRAPTGASNKNILNGTATSVFEGAFYFPNQELQVGGNASMTFTCAQFVARTVTFDGNGGVTNTCTGGYGTKSIWGRHVRLVG